MTESPQPKSSMALIGSLSALLIIAAAFAAYYVVQNNKAEEQIASLTSQLGDSQKKVADSEKKIADSEAQITSLKSQIDELQPLAKKATTLPVSLAIDRHAINQGYNLIVHNLARESLRFRVTVNDRVINLLIDGGKFRVVRGLASGDNVTVESEGYDPKTITIQ